MYYLMRVKLLTATPTKLFSGTWHRIFW